MNVTWLTQGGFLFESCRARLVIDPYMSNCLEATHGMPRLVPFPLTLVDLRADWLFSTHDHLDHFDPQTIQQIAVFYPACRFAGPPSCYEHFVKLGLPPARFTVAGKGSVLHCGAFELQPVLAAHSDPYAVGIVLKAEGKQVYLSGDSKFLPELVNEQTCGSDVVVICINGKFNNMDAADALKVVDSIRPRLALPMHYGLFAENTVDPQSFIDGCRRMDVQSFAMPIGKDFVL